MQWCMPFGVLTPASWMALNSTRYMHEFGVRSEDIGRAVVQLRQYALTNPAAWGYQRPMTLEDHQASRWIVEPCIHLLDCCQETDGSVAVVITSRERSADLPQLPVAIGAAAGAGLFEQEIASDHYRGDLSVMEGSVALARRLFGSFGFDREDIDVAMIYDAFSPILLMQLEALGFCGPGEAKDFVAAGNRRGLHPRAEPGARGHPSTARDGGQPDPRCTHRAGHRQPDRRHPHHPMKRGRHP
jgi:acetyl-CoA acetyltransferase